MIVTELHNVSFILSDPYNPCLKLLQYLYHVIIGTPPAPPWTFLLAPPQRDIIGTP